MKEQLATIRSEALAAFAQAGSSAELDALRVKYLGKKGELTAVLKQMGKLSADAPALRYERHHGGIPDRPGGPVRAVGRDEVL